ncbi:MAG TPA: DUF1801 domain-containing protein [Candidatus Polarisedimenticolia bacterium]|nr:DUF1801 domain-containing protein [Candidatus Polarisedimenticolia bacterium]
MPAWVGLRNRDGENEGYASFDAYLKDQVPKNQPIIRALRRFVKRVEPELSESVKWGNGCRVGRSGPVAYVYSAPGYVQFGFLYGSSLKDPEGLLEGNGQYVRHIKVFDPSGIDETAFAALLTQATVLCPGRARAGKTLGRGKKQGKATVHRIGGCHQQEKRRSVLKAAPPLKSQPLR